MEKPTSHFDSEIFRHDPSEVGSDTSQRNGEQDTTEHGDELKRAAQERRRIARIIKEAQAQLNNRDGSMSGSKSVRSRKAPSSREAPEYGSRTDASVRTM